MTMFTPTAGHNFLGNPAQNVTPPVTGDPTRLYTQIQNNDPERTSGSQTRYKSFDDFVTTFEIEAKKPHIVGAADILDIINPLQHLPLISKLYRELTDDQIKPGAQMMGAAMFGGGVGLASAAVNTAVENETGKDIAGNMALALTGAPSFNTRENINNDEQPSILAMGLAPELSKESSTAEPNAPLSVHIAWNNADGFERAQTRSPQHAASTYQRVAGAGTKAPSPADMNGTAAQTPTIEIAPNTRGHTYEIVKMTDPERMAGSFARYV